MMVVACQTDVQKPSTSGESSFMKSDSHMKSMSCITGCKNLALKNYPQLLVCAVFEVSMDISVM